MNYVAEPVGAPVSEFGRPLITHVFLDDLDQDGLVDILYSEGQKNSVRWIRQSPRGTFSEQVIGPDIAGPAHVATADVDGDGDKDVLVASMGQISPNNDLIGAIAVLENLGDGQFQRRVLLQNVARVTDVRAANLSGHTDGRLDLVVAQFGYAQGESRWMRNLGDWQFESHVISRQSGAIHAPVTDFDGDGHPDFAVLLSQEWEEVHVFRNRGRGEFNSGIVWGSTNEDFGSSGLSVADVNGDGRPDLVYTNGDGFDYAVRGHRPWHGLQWLENTGTGFVYRRVGDLPGAYAPVAADLDGDGHQDLLAVSGFADWDQPGAVSIMAWINDGRQRFTPHVLAHKPIQLITADAGDLDGDGRPEIVTGGFHAFEPFEEMSAVTLWRLQP